CWIRRPHRTRYSVGIASFLSRGYTTGMNGAPKFNQPPQPQQRKQAPKQGIGLGQKLRAMLFGAAVATGAQMGTNAVQDRVDAGKKKTATTAQSFGPVGEKIIQIEQELDTKRNEAYEQLPESNNIDDRRPNTELQEVTNGKGDKHETSWDLEKRYGQP